MLKELTKELPRAITLIIGVLHESLVHIALGDIGGGAEGSELLLTFGGGFDKSTMTGEEGEEGDTTFADLQGGSPEEELALLGLLGILRGVMVEVECVKVLLSLSFYKRRPNLPQRRGPLTRSAWVHILASLAQSNFCTSCDSLLLHHMKRA